MIEKRENYQVKIEWIYLALLHTVTLLSTTSPSRYNLSVFPLLYSTSGSQPSH